MHSAKDVLSGTATWGVDNADATAWAKSLPDDSVHCIVTSPPYFALRSYLPDGHPDKAKEMGAEQSPAAYVAAMVALFRELRRVLHPSGTCWVNIGASYSAGGQSKTSSTISKSGTNGVGESGGVVSRADVNEPFALRDDLTPDEMAYVLSELAAVFRESGEPVGPVVPVGVDS